MGHNFDYRHWCACILTDALSKHIVGVGDPMVKGLGFEICDHAIDQDEHLELDEIHQATAILGAMLDLEMNYPIDPHDVSHELALADISVSMLDRFGFLDNGGDIDLRTVALCLLCPDEAPLVMSVELH